jgi:hypothetical protein
MGSQTNESALLFKRFFRGFPSPELQSGFTNPASSLASRFSAQQTDLAMLPAQALASERRTAFRCATRLRGPAEWEFGVLGRVLTVSP